MNSNEIRTKFLEYFQSLDHKVLNSASLIPHDENRFLAGVGEVALKDYFSDKTLHISEYDFITKMYPNYRY